MMRVVFTAAGHQVTMSTSPQSPVTIEKSVQRCLGGSISDTSDTSESGGAAIPLTIEKIPVLAKSANV